MHIVNAMFARGGGGIEQACVDYCEALKMRGHRVTALIHPGAWAEKQLEALGIEIIRVRNFGEWDFLAVRRLRSILMHMKPDAVIAHANRPFGLLHKAIRGKIPLIGVVQNYSTSRYGAGNAVFTTTRDLIDTLVAQGISAHRIFHIPNMVKCSELPMRSSRRRPPIIGTMGRFVDKKGFDYFIGALSELKLRGLQFKAVIGGGGAEDQKLRNLAKEKGLENHLEFLGWVDNRKSFYTGIDIFCLPSLHEPFGIVLLEAFAHGAPVVSTDSEGPKEIITPNFDAIIVDKANAKALADGLEKLLTDVSYSDGLAANGFAKVKTRYSLEVVGERMEEALSAIIANFRK